MMIETVAGDRYREDGLLHRLRRLARRQPTGVASAVIIVTIVVLSLAAPVLGTDDPYEIDTPNRLAAPSGNSWFGTDHVGRDVYSRTVYGGRVSLLVGFSVAALSVVPGLIFGLITGYNRRMDMVIMRVMEGIMAIPGILLAITLVAALGASVLNVVIALAIVEVPSVVRLVRAAVLSLKEQVFVEAARAIGASPLRIVAVHIAPNVITPLIVIATFICAAAILSEAYLSFVGAGPPDIASWGNVMAEARVWVRQAVWVVFYPGLVLAVLVTALNVAGDALRDYLDPRLRRLA